MSGNARLLIASLCLLKNEIAGAAAAALAISTSHTWAEISAQTTQCEEILGTHVEKRGTFLRRSVHRFYRRLSHARGRGELPHREAEEGEEKARRRL